MLDMLCYYFSLALNSPLACIQQIKTCITHLCICIWRYPLPLAAIWFEEQITIKQYRLNNQYAISVITDVHCTICKLCKKYKVVKDGKGVLAIMQKISNGHRITYKVATIIYCTPNCQQPGYLLDSLISYKPARTLCSSSSDLLIVPHGR